MAVVCDVEYKMLGMDLSPSILRSHRSVEAGPFLTERWWGFAWFDTVPQRMTLPCHSAFSAQAPASNDSHVRKLW